MQSLRADVWMLITFGVLTSERSQTISLGYLVYGKHTHIYRLVLMYRASYAPVSTGYPELYFNKSIKKSQAPERPGDQIFLQWGTNRSPYGSLVWTLMRVAFLEPGFF